MSQGGSVSSSSGRSMNNLSTLDPVAGGLANLFGGSIQNLPGGGFTTNLPSNILPNVFQPGDFQDLGTLTSPLNPVQFDLSQFGSMGQGAMNTLSEAANTGLIGPATDLFGQLFREKAAGIAEQSGLAGINANDIDFQSALLREAQLGSTQLADLAQSRRLQASSALPSVLGGFLDLEQGARSAERMRTGGGQQMALLQALGGFGTEAGGAGSSRQKSQSISGQFGLK
jgi:hypothetical protein